MESVLAEELTWDELRREAQRGCLFVLSVAPLEDHASHLPCGTDPMICEALATRMVELAEPVPATDIHGEPIRAVILPTWVQGASLLGSLGCLRWRPKLLKNALVSYGRELAGLGARRLLLLSSHGAFDHLSALEVAAARLERETAMLVLAPSAPLLNGFLAGDYREEVEQHLGRPFSPEESSDLTGDVHAAGWETSLLLHLRPELVSETYRELPKFEVLKGKRVRLRALSRHRGYFGAPAAASAELGRACFEALSTEASKVIEEFLARPLRCRSAGTSRRSESVGLRAAGGGLLLLGLGLAGFLAVNGKPTGQQREQLRRTLRRGLERLANEALRTLDTGPESRGQVPSPGGADLTDPLTRLALADEQDERS